MKLRRLEQKDAVRMLEWMHDETVVEKLHTNFAVKTIRDCSHFITNCCDNENLHLAITNDKDEYMGTVSLKHITTEAAEFAITVHKDAMGKGYAIWAMKEMLRKAFEEYKLKQVYWCVAYDNIRALKFYDKNQYSRVKSNELKIKGDYTKEEISSYVWYAAQI